MPNTTTRLTINIDVEAASVKAKQLVADLQRLGQSGESAGIQIQSGMGRAGQGMRKAGDDATTAAVKFQTATQGMLNLSTTAVQTYTSISNLARAQNRAEAAAVGQQRAQDALNRFQIKYNKLLESGTASTRDLTQAQNELNTAMEDYKVKAEKAKIEADAVLDIQLLFFANIANVGVSSLQVLSSMLSASTKTMIANSVQTKLNSIEKWNNTWSLTSNTGAANVNAIAYNKNAVAALGATASTKGLTLAQRALNIAMGPIGWITLGVSAAFTVYETNAWGAKDAINGLLGIQDDLKTGMNESGVSAENFAKQLEKMGDVSGKKLPDSFRKLKEEVIKLRQEMKITGAEAGVMFQTTAYNTQQASIKINKDFQNAYKVGSGFSSGGETTQPRKGIKLEGGYFGGAWDKIFGNLSLPEIKEAYGLTAEEAGIMPFGKRESIFVGPVDPKRIFGIQAFNVIKDLPAVVEAGISGRVLKSVGLTPQKLAVLPPDKRKKAEELALELGVYEDTLASDELQRKFAELVNIQLIAENKTPKEFIDFPNIENILDPKDRMIVALLTDKSELKNLNFLPDERSRPAFIAALLRTGQERFIRDIDFDTRDFILNGLPLNPRLGRLVGLGKAYSAGKRIDSYSLSGLDKTKPATVNQLTRYLSFSALENTNSDILRILGVKPFDTLQGTRNIIIGSKLNKKLKKIQDSGSAKRAEVFVATGVDIGAIADTVSAEDAMRIGQLEANLRDGLFMRSPDNLLYGGLKFSAIEFHGVTMVGTKTGYGKDGVPFVVRGKEMEVHLSGRKYILPVHDEDVYNALNKIASESNFSMAKAIADNQGMVWRHLTESGKIKNFGSNFFSASKGAGGLGVFKGLSATAAYQAVGQFKIDPIFEEMRKERDRYVNTGQIFADRLLDFAKYGTLRNTTLSRSAADSNLVKKLNVRARVIRAFNSLYNGFGSGGISDSLINEMYDSGFEDEAEIAVSLNERLDAVGTISGALGLRKDMMEQVYKPILASVGLDTNFNQKLKAVTKYRWSRGFKVGYTDYELDGYSPDDLLKINIGAAGVNIPSVGIDLVRRAMIFSQNKFSDFNDMNIAKTAYDVLHVPQGLSNQEIWDIRFNTTKGDRELENRMRYERMRAASSGTTTL